LITASWTTPVIVQIFTIGVYQYLNPVMDIDKIIVGLYIMELLKIKIKELPQFIVAIIDSLVSMRRIEVKIFPNFLMKQTKIINFFFNKKIF